MNFPVSHSIIVRLAVAALLACPLGACTEPKAHHHDSQVAAKVNGDEITVSQLNHVLSQLGVSNQQQAERAQRNALNQLIDIHLLEKKALQLKLDRNPEVLQALESSRQQVLAQAYINNVLQQSGMSMPDAAEIRKYYNQHSDLFAKRRVYSLRRITIEGAPAKIRSVRHRLGEQKSARQLTAWLDSQGIHFTTRDETKAAEDLPMGLLPKLDRLRDGDILDMDPPGENNALHVVQLIRSEEQPLTEEEAAPVIARYLLNKKRIELTHAEVKRLRASADIKLLGSFARAPAGEAAVATAQEKHRGNGGEDSSYMDKGLAGLK